MFRSIIFDVVLLLEKEITYILYEKSINFYDFFRFWSVKYQYLVCKLHKNHIKLKINSDILYTGLTPFYNILGLSIACLTNFNFLPLDTDFPLFYYKDQPVPSKQSFLETCCHH